MSDLILILLAVFVPPVCLAAAVLIIRARSGIKLRRGDFTDAGLAMCAFWVVILMLCGGVYAIYALLVRML